MNLPDNIPRWLLDLDSKAASMPFGKIDIVVTRHKSVTSKVEVVKVTKIQPKSNEEAFSDLEKLINSMVLAGFDGKLEFGIVFKKGTMVEITIKNKDVKNYHGQSN